MPTTNDCFCKMENERNAYAIRKINVKTVVWVSTNPSIGKSNDASIWISHYVNEYMFKWAAMDSFT